ncbi:MAG TPA: glycosyltransferase [Azospirillaceae bacterium]|nr:glycosyltransferase [Azospirillaceae bacterium]
MATVVLNDLPGLLATRDSLRRQSFRDFEWLVADGGSSDGTAAWLAAHSGECAWWRSGPDLGPYDAMNRCLDQVRADAVLFLNAGDTLANDRALAGAMRLMAEAGADYVYADALERTPTGALGLKPARSYRLAPFGMFAHHQAMIYRMALIGRLRYDLSYPIGADYDFTLSFLAARARVARLKAPLCVFQGGGASFHRAAEGRWEQARIRRRRYPIATLWNMPLLSIQWMAFTFRTLFPGAYAAMRYRDVKR